MLQKVFLSVLLVTLFLLFLFVYSAKRRERDQNKESKGGYDWQKNALKIGKWILIGGGILTILFGAEYVIQFDWTSISLGRAIEHLLGAGSAKWIWLLVALGLLALVGNVLGSTVIKNLFPYLIVIIAVAGSIYGLGLASGLIDMPGSTKQTKIVTKPNCPLYEGNGVPIRIVHNVKICRTIRASEKSVVFRVPNGYYVASITLDEDLGIRPDDLLVANNNQLINSNGPIDRRHSVRFKLLTGVGIVSYTIRVLAVKK